MKYFMPDWEDKVDPTFDFRTDTYTPNRIVSEDLYAHQIFATPPYDGILLSRAVVEKSQVNYETLQRQGARKYLRLPGGLEVFGDCGAFSYINEDEPWYETEDVLEYYHTIRVNYGASVDHLVVSTLYTTEVVEKQLPDGTTSAQREKRKQEMSLEECKRRVQLTLDNAQEFKRLHKKRRYRFTPVGVAQGWNPESYAASVRDLLKMGYAYIALGGLARSPAPQVLAVVRATAKVLEEFHGHAARQIGIHLFGVAKLTLIDELPLYGITSIDSASYLRKAWLRSGQNYLGADGGWYTAIRVPQSSNPEVRKTIAANGKILAEIQQQEKLILQTLQRYNDGGLSTAELESLLDSIVEYDNYLLRDGDDGQSLRDRDTAKAKYRRTLEAQPWRDCSCEVCRHLGVHALIFRGTNRNKRRGFHNTWTFYQRLRKGNLSTPVQKRQ